MVQGTSSGAGKTTLVTALCRIFSDMGYSVAPFKAQNMSSFSYRGRGFRISRAQAVQAVGARTAASPDMNPVLLEPLGGLYSTVYLNGKRLRRMHYKEYHYEFAPLGGMAAALAALRRLGGARDIVILEGAGSPAEINLQRYDIANMAMAEKARAPVILVSDIDRGGSFASLAGTMLLLPERHKKLVRGFVLNRFRGDPAVLRPAYPRLKRAAGRGILGVVPMIDMDIPGEDSLDAGNGGSSGGGSGGGAGNGGGGAPSRQPPPYMPRQRPPPPATDPFSWTPREVERLDSEIDRLAKAVRASLDMRAVEEMVLGGR